MPKRIVDRPHKKRCRSCSEWFVPDCRNYPHQHFCGKPECRQASKTASQKKWLAKNPDYFRDGPEKSTNLERVRAWRARNPKYWQREKRFQNPTKQCSSTKTAAISQENSDATVSITEQSLPPTPLTLQDLLIPQFSEESSVPLQNKEIALQDLLIKHHFVLEGLTSHLFGDALQDPARSALDLCYDMGRKKNCFDHSFNPKTTEGSTHDP